MKTRKLYLKLMPKCAEMESALKTMPKPTAGFSNKLNEAKKSVAKLQTEQAKMISKLKKHPCRI